MFKKSVFSAFVLSVITCALILLPSTSFAGVNQWTSNGPYGGYIRALAVSPNYATDQTVFTGSVGTVYKTTDGGDNWATANSGISTGNIITSLAISPNYASDQTVFVGLNSYGGVFKTTNGGATWAAVNSGIINYDVRSIAISPNYAVDQTLFAGTSYGVYKSTDGGVSWTAVNTGISETYAFALAISPNYAIDQTVYMGNSYGKVYKTKNGGASWTAVYAATTSSLGSYTINSLAISPNYISDQTVYFGNYSGRVYKTTDEGVSWTSTYIGADVSSLTISPNYAEDQTVYTGTSGTYYSGGIYKTTNGGISWTAVNSGISNTPLGILSLAISPNYATDQTVFTGLRGGGVFRTTSGGSTWMATNIGISSSYILSLTVSPNYSIDNTVFAGSYVGMFKTINSGTSWTAVNSGIPMGYSSWSSIYSLDISPNYALDQTIFAGTSGGGVQKSTNGGTSWTAINTGITNFSIISLAISQNYALDQTIFAGTSGGGVYKSTNGGASWTAVNSGISNNYIWSLVISPNYIIDQTVYVGTSGGGVYKSTNGGVNWTAINSGISGSSITSLAISPNYVSDQTVFAGTTHNGLFKTTNGGVSWASSGLTSTTIHSIAISPNYAADNTIFVGTGWGGLHGGWSSQGVYKSTNRGVSWATMNSGLPAILAETSPTISVSPNYATDHTVFAGTTGYGVFSYTLSTNSPPVANADTKSNAEDTAFAFLAGDLTVNDTDSDGDYLTVTGVAATANTHGTVTLIGNIITYIPEANFNGSASFTYVISDGRGGSATTTVTINVTPVNDSPVANDDDLGNTPEDTTPQIVILDALLANDTDVDIGDTLSLSSVTNSSHGIVTDNGDGTLTYTLDENYNGSDSFTYTIRDNGGATDTATVSINVTPVNDAPVAVGDTDTTAEDTVINIPDALLLAGDSDIEGDSLSIISVSNPANGTVSRDNTTGINTFTPNASFNGDASFDYTISDGNGGNATATVTVNVTPVNDPPVANDDDLGYIDEDTSYVINILDALLANDGDIDGDALNIKNIVEIDVDGDGFDDGSAFKLSSLPSNGTLVNNNDGTLTYTPNANYNVGDSFTYTLNDGNGGTDTATVIINITPVNDAPIANAGLEQTIHTGNVVTLDGSLSSDIDMDSITYEWSVVSQPSGSNISLSDKTLVNPSFTPMVNGDYVLKLIVTDSNGAASQADQVTVSTTNSAPVADAGLDQLITLVGSTIELDGSQSYDVDGDTLVYSWEFISKPDGSNTQIANANTDKPSFVADKHGDYEVRFTVTDQWGDTSVDTVMVGFENIKPVADAGTSTMLAIGEMVYLNGNGSFDANGDFLFYNWSLISFPQNSQALIVDTTSTVSFLPDEPGTYLAQLIVNDGIVDSDPSTVQIEVITKETAATIAAEVLDEQIAILPPTALQNPNMQNALINKINAVVDNIEAGNYQDALNQLENDILKKTDGWATIGQPDKNDWITDIESQKVIYPYVLELIQKVEALF